MVLRGGIGLERPIGGHEEFWHFEDDQGVWNGLTSSGLERPMECPYFEEELVWNGQ